MEDKTDIHKKDKLFTKGTIEGHADKKNKIRKKDGIFFKGDEVGQIKDKKAHDLDGLIFKGKEFGYVDKDNNVRQKDGLLFKGKIIGKVRGNNKDAALGHFVLKFKRLEYDFDQLKLNFEKEKNKDKFLNRIEIMLDRIQQSESLGDFDKLIDHTKKLRQQTLYFINNNLREKKRLINKARDLSSSTDWKETHQEYKELDLEWKSIGYIPRDRQEDTWNSYKRAKQLFYDRQSDYYDQKQRDWANRRR